ncbi:hypothetical protein WN55_04134 [Dufourea novaeangliae]|uniref:Uncharacterized protein n=1 Tax=Dufourea novaeangliae TaxID=178035 RepID=A0A154PMY9_DUFNO|nr:hypothetical protein WN55_04134 [Dufourea novaeangliae]
MNGDSLRRRGKENYSLVNAVSGGKDPSGLDQDTSAPMPDESELWMQQLKGNLPGPGTPFARLSVEDSAGQVNQRLEVVMIGVRSNLVAPTESVGLTVDLSDAFNVRTKLGGTNLSIEDKPLGTLVHQQGFALTEMLTEDNLGT